METSQPGELDPAAIKRLIREELPGLDEQVRINPRRVGLYRIVPRVWVSLYTGAMDSSSLPLRATDEVEDYAWIEPLSVPNLWLRQGRARNDRRCAVWRHGSRATFLCETAIATNNRSLAFLPSWLP